MTERFRAYIVEDNRLDPLAQEARLMVVDRPGFSAARVLVQDGSWREVQEGEQIGDAGIVLPREALPALAAAVEAWQGKTNHAVTEASVLREWLAVERGRVDDELGKNRA